MRSSPDAKNMWSTLRESQIQHVGALNSGEDYIIDAWGHPLLFVPGSGLRGVQFGEGPTARNGYVQPVTGPIEAQGIRSPDGRAFWVSAGPDGFYDTHDDNIYSFNN
jgi:hypothetical protein